MAYMVLYAVAALQSAGAEVAVCKHLQAAPVVGRAKWVLRLFVGNWEKLLVAAILIALVVLVSVKVSPLHACLLAMHIRPEGLVRHVHLPSWVPCHVAS